MYLVILAIVCLATSSLVWWLVNFLPDRMSVETAQFASELLVIVAMALLAADHGKRVLVIEVDAKGNIADRFEHSAVGFEPQEVHPGVFALEQLCLFAK